MSRFYVGQRVRVARPYPRKGESYAPHPSCFIGCEATVRGTTAMPNEGFNPRGKCNVSIQPDGFPRCGMVYGSMLEPITPPGMESLQDTLALWQPEGEVSHG